MTTILVTGGAGFIGSHVCKALLKRKDKVICIDNFNNYYDPKQKENNIEIMLKNPEFKLYRADITDGRSLKRIFDENKIEKVIHLAARAGVRASIEDPVLYADVNVKGTINILECIKQVNEKDGKMIKFVFASSSSVYGGNKKVPFSENDKVDDPISPYAATKRAGELMCRTYNCLYKIPIACLRFFTVYGPRNRPDMALHKFTKCIIDGKELQMFGNGDSSRDYTYIEDIVQGILASLDKKFDFEIFNLGNSKPVKLRAFIAAIEKAAGKKALIRRMPEQQGDVDVTFADISKAKKLLGYKPEVGIEEGVKRYVAWYKKSIKPEK